MDDFKLNKEKKILGDIPRLPFNNGLESSIRDHRLTGLVNVRLLDSIGQIHSLPMNPVVTVRNVNFVILLKTDQTDCGNFCHYFGF